MKNLNFRNVKRPTHDYIKIVIGFLLAVSFTACGGKSVKKTDSAKNTNLPEATAQPIAATLKMGRLATYEQSDLAPSYDDAEGYPMYLASVDGTYALISKEGKTLYEFGTEKPQNAVIAKSPNSSYVTFRSDELSMIFDGEGTVVVGAAEKCSYYTVSTSGYYVEKKLVEELSGKTTEYRIKEIGGETINCYAENPVYYLGGDIFAVQCIWKNSLVGQEGTIIVDAKNNIEYKNIDFGSENDDIPSLFWSYPNGLRYKCINDSIDNVFVILPYDTASKKCSYYICDGAITKSEGDFYCNPGAYVNYNNYGADYVSTINREYALFSVKESNGTSKTHYYIVKISNGHIVCDISEGGCDTVYYRDGKFYIISETGFYYVIDEKGNYVVQPTNLSDYGGYTTGSISPISNYDLLYGHIYIKENDGESQKVLKYSEDMTQVEETYNGGFNGSIPGIVEIYANEENDKYYDAETGKLIQVIRQ